MKRLVAILAVSAVAVSFLLGRLTVKAPAAGVARAPLYYIDPMHPAYRSEKPGIAPDCGMKLVAVYASDSDGQGGTRPSPANSIHVSLSRQQKSGIEVEAAASGAADARLAVTGRVVPDDRRIYRVSSGVAGWIRQTLDDSVGSYVRKDQRLAAFYSPEFLALEQGYLVATERLVGASKSKDVAGIQSTTARLKNLGMSDAQIDEIGRTRQVPEFVDLVAPASGYIISRNLAIGEKFEQGAEFYRIADLSHVWIEAQIPQEAASGLRPGSEATVRIAGEGRLLRARVSQVLPQLDASSSLAMVRLEADNAGNVLRPEMRVDVEVEGRNRGAKVPHAAAVSVPVDAVVDTGLQQTVFVDTGAGYFEPRRVTTGLRSGSRVQILTGLAAGERVVVQGAFLLNSEASLRRIDVASPAVEGKL